MGLVNYREKLLNEDYEQATSRLYRLSCAQRAKLIFLKHWIKLKLLNLGIKICTKGPVSIINIKDILKIGPFSFFIKNRRTKLFLHSRFYEIARYYYDNHFVDKFFLFIVPKWSKNVQK